MSFFRGIDPEAGNAYQCEAIAHVVVPRTVDLGDHFLVRRGLPSARSRMVGPFIFFDHFGPAEFRGGNGLDVRPHPHIGLATVTYLFDGEIMHRDSLGTLAAIRPGEVNWMTAGKGIAHSERTAPERRVDGETIHGLQCWVALPATKEEMNPDFVHYGTGDFPVIKDGGKTVRVMAGEVYGARSPLVATSDTMFADITLSAGARLPVDAVYDERAIYVVKGEIDIAGDRFGEARLIVLRRGDAITLTAVDAAQIVLVGGEPMDGPRHIWWNFVSSRKERIEEAKAAWKSGKFAIVPGDEKEFIPLPEPPKPPERQEPGTAPGTAP
jgi:redox-sensitive bicupin YhaK (pirin superfamily)